MTHVNPQEKKALLLTRNKHETNKNSWMLRIFFTGFGPTHEYNQISQIDMEGSQCALPLSHYCATIEMGLRSKCIGSITEICLCSYDIDHSGRSNVGACDCCLSGVLSVERAGPTFSNDRQKLTKNGKSIRDL